MCEKPEVPENIEITKDQGSIEPVAPPNVEETRSLNNDNG